MEARSWKTLDAAIEAQGFSGAVRVRSRGDVVYQRASGFADRANKIRNTTATRFGIASGTKLLTALGIGYMIDVGKLTLATRLRDCVSVELPAYHDEITLQHLLTHTSGIPDYLDEELIDDFDDVKLDVPWYELKGPKDYLAVLSRSGAAPMKTLRLDSEGSRRVNMPCLSSCLRQSLGRHLSR